MITTCDGLASFSIDVVKGCVFLSMYQYYRTEWSLRVHNFIFCGSMHFVMPNQLSKLFGSFSTTLIFSSPTRYPCQSWQLLLNSSLVMTYECFCLLFGSKKKRILIRERISICRNVVLISLCWLTFVDTNPGQKGITLCKSVSHSLLQSYALHLLILNTKQITPARVINKMKNMHDKKSGCRVPKCSFDFFMLVNVLWIQAQVIQGILYANPCHSLLQT